MKKNIFFLCLIFAGWRTFAKENFPDLSVSNISGELKAGAHAVYRFDSTKIKVDNINKVHFVHNYAVTILDEKGLNYSKLLESYNKNIQINDIDAILLDATGKEIRSLRNRDVLDYSSYGSSFEFNSDQRYKIFDFQQKVYPYTIIFNVEETIKTLFFLPDWNIRNTTSTSVQSAYFELDFLSDSPVRFKEYQLPANAVKTQKKEDNHEIITWSIVDLYALKDQPYSQVGNFSTPNIQLSPTKFQLFEHDGEISSWKDFGLFIYQLNVDRDKLPDDKGQLVKSMIANESTTYGKIQKLYSYMQQSTRYVADEYGIAGWQTFEAKDVCRTGYGDCKGLVNYMKALLKAADIKAYTTLVFAGEEDYFKLDRDFPANNFNHVILCVPQATDTIWIECTSQDLPAGYLGNFTQDRDALITTENGGILTHTPAYNHTNNYAIRKATLHFKLENGNSQTVLVDNQYFGPFQDEMSHAVKTKSEKDIRNIVNEKFNFPTYSVKNYKYQNEVNEQHIPYLIENAEIESSSIINSTQKRTFINLAWMKNPMTDLFQTDARTLPIVINQSFAVTDTIIVELPRGMEVESMPSEKHIKQPFAEYDLNFEIKGQNMIMIRKFVQNAGVFDMKLYSDYQNMYKDIQAEKEGLKIVTLNKAS